MIPTISTFGKTPRLTLVGAGPGDPDLITLKGWNALKSADAVLFDALVSDSIISMIPQGTPAFSVGKRAGAHSSSQDEINELIVDCAFLYGHVVRLKGGDPFVFGRGAEEIDYAHRHGLQTEVIPGISSAIAVPASVGIPVTSRGISESFWVVTGTTRSGLISADIALAAKSSATVVILMGMNKIEQIMDAFVAEGKSEIPVAIIQNGTLPNEKSVVGTVATIVSLVRDEDLNTPGIIIIGEVVRHARKAEELVTAITKNYQ